MNLPPFDNSLESAEQFIDAIKRYSQADFDGHTEFLQLDAEQKLMWLSQVAQFYFQNSNKAALGEWTNP